VSVRPALSVTIHHLWPAALPIFLHCTVAQLLDIGERDSAVRELSRGTGLVLDAGQSDATGFVELATQAERAAADTITADACLADVITPRSGPVESTSD
jgi:hypothetical protein